MARAILWEPQATLLLLGNSLVLLPVDPYQDILANVLLHERENYIGLTVAKAVVYPIDKRSMDCIFEIAWFRSN